MSTVNGPWEHYLVVDEYCEQSMCKFFGAARNAFMLFCFADFPANVNPIELLPRPLRQLNGFFTLQYLPSVFRNID